MHSKCKCHISGKIQLLSLLHNGNCSHLALAGCLARCSLCFPCFTSPLAKEQGRSGSCGIVTVGIAPLTSPLRHPATLRIWLNVHVLSAFIDYSDVEKEPLSVDLNGYLLMIWGLWGWSKERNQACVMNSGKRTNFFLVLTSSNLNCK